MKYFFSIRGTSVVAVAGIGLFAHWILVGSAGAQNTSPAYADIALIFDEN